MPVSLFCAKLRFCGDEPGIQIHKTKPGFCGASQVEEKLALHPSHRMGWRSLVAATFQPVGEEELELRVAPGTNSGLLAVQQVTAGCYQGKVRKAKRGPFVSLPSSSSSLLAAWFVAKALKAREDGTLETSSFMSSMEAVRPPRPCPQTLF